jgi:hypothetical protein
MTIVARIPTALNMIPSVLAINDSIIPEDVKGSYETVGIAYYEGNPW